MANIKEAWIDDIAVTFRISRGTRSVVLEGSTFSEDGTPLRRFGPIDISANLPSERQEQMVGWEDEIKAQIMGAFEIDPADILDESPFTPMGEVAAAANGGDMPVEIPPQPEVIGGPQAQPPTEPKPTP